MMKKLHRYFLMALMSLATQLVFAYNCDEEKSLGKHDEKITNYYAQKHKLAIEQSHLNFYSDRSKSERRNIQLVPDMSSSERAKKYVWGFQWLAYVSQRFFQSDSLIVVQDDELERFVKDDLDAIAAKVMDAQRFEKKLQVKRLKYPILIYSIIPGKITARAIEMNRGKMPKFYGNQHHDIQKIYASLWSVVETIGHPGEQITKLKADNVREEYVPCRCLKSYESLNNHITAMTAGKDRTLEIKDMLDRNFGI